MLLTEKYKEILDSSKMPLIKESERGQIALLLNNQAKEESRLMSEGTTSTDVAEFNPLFMPLARRIMPTLIANELVGIQPLNGPVALIQTLKFRYIGMGENKDDRYNGRISPVKNGQVIEVDVTGTLPVKGDSIKVGSATATVIYVEQSLLLVDKSIGSASLEVKDSADVTIGTIVNTYSNELSFRKILKGYTGSLPTTEAELLGYDMAEIGFDVSSVQIKAESRKLKASYTVEMYQDLKAMYGKLADEELMNMMSVEVLNELDREIVDSVNSWAAPASDFKIGGVDGSGSNRFELENMAHLTLKIAQESREIARMTRRGAGNILLVSPRVATVLEGAKGYISLNKQSEVNLGVGVGVSVIGTFNGMKVIQDNFTDRDYVTVLYKGSSRTDAIGYYAPYIPLSYIRVVHPDSGQPGIILNTRYGLIENPLNQDGGGIFARTFNVNFEDSFLK